MKPGDREPFWVKDEMERVSSAGKSKEIGLDSIGERAVGASRSIIHI